MGAIVFGAPEAQKIVEADRELCVKDYLEMTEDDETQKRLDELKALIEDTQLEMAVLEQDLDEYQHEYEQILRLTRLGIEEEREKLQRWQAMAKGADDAT